MTTGKNPETLDDARLRVASDAALPQSSVLIVDDNEANRDSLSRRLIRKGYAVSAVVDGAAALSQLARAKYDVVLLDVMMPGMSGWEVLEQIRRTHSQLELPVIMATAKDQTEDIVKAFHLGANDYVTKPVDFGVTLARVQTQLALRHSVKRIVDLEQQLQDRNADLEVANSALVQSAERTRRELQMAARVQQAFLPKSMPNIPGLEFAWAFKPCQQLAGDSLNICHFDAEYVGFYVLDVAGHGAAPALLAVAAARVLSAARDSDSILLRPANEMDAGQPVPPGEVAEHLNRRFGSNSGTERLLTFFYVLLNVRSYALTYVSAGHPAAVRVQRAGGCIMLEGSGMPIGVGDTYEEQSAQLQPGDRLYLYTDGVTEAMNSQRQMFGTERFNHCLERGRAVSLKDSVAQILRTVEEWNDGVAVQDDISVLAVETSDQVKG